MPSPTETIAAALQEELMTRTHEVPFLIVYPRHRSHSAVMAVVLRDLAHKIYYYPLREEDTLLRTMLGNLVDDMQFPTDFGHQTRQALQESNAPQDWAAAFAADLGALRSDPFIVTFDEMDRLNPNVVEVDSFFRALPQYMPPQAQIMINGRELYRQPWNDLILEGVAAALGDNIALSAGIFTETADRGQIEFYALSGHSRVLSDGRPVRSWDGSLPRNLCYYFIDHPMVTRDEIFRVFWPHLGVKEATNVFHVTKRKISEKLEYEITAYDSGFYVPSAGVNILYDAHEFEVQIEEATNGPENLSSAKWYRAVQLYRHPFLEGLNMPWMVEKREKLRTMFAQSLIGLGRMHSTMGETERSLGYFLRAVNEKPDREDVHRDIMNLYYQMGQQDEIHNQYRVLEETLHNTLGIAPSNETKELYTSLTSR